MKANYYYNKCYNCGSRKDLDKSMEFELDNGHYIEKYKVCKKCAAEARRTFFGDVNFNIILDKNL